jgi:hypothetical protein
LKHLSISFKKSKEILLVVVSEFKMIGWRLYFVFNMYLKLNCGGAGLLIKDVNMVLGTVGARVNLWARNKWPWLKTYLWYV